METHSRKIRADTTTLTPAVYACTVYARFVKLVFVQHWNLWSNSMCVWHYEVLGMGEYSCYTCSVKKSGIGASLINNNVWTPYVFDSDICYLSSSHCKKRTESCCSAHVTTKSLRQNANFSHMKCRRILSAVTCIAVQLFLRCISLAAGPLLEHLMLHQSLFH